MVELCFGIDMNKWWEMFELNTSIVANARAGTSIFYFIKSIARTERSAYFHTKKKEETFSIAFNRDPPQTAFTTFHPTRVNSTTRAIAFNKRHRSSSRHSPALRFVVRAYFVNI